jgi:hypothetical protein
MIQGPFGPEIFENWNYPWDDARSGRDVAAVFASTSRLKGMEGHALIREGRGRKKSPDE